MRELDPRWRVQYLRAGPKRVAEHRDLTWTQGQNGKRGRSPGGGERGRLAADEVEPARLGVAGYDTPRWAAFRVLEASLLREGIEAAALRFRELRDRSPRLC